MCWCTIHRLMSYLYLNDADDSVIDDRAYCSDSSIFFPLTKMFFNLKNEKYVSY